MWSGTSRRRHPFGFIGLLEPLEARWLLAVSVELVRDIAAGTQSSFPANGLAHDGVLYFAASNKQGIELWRTDAEKGAVLLKNINGEGSASPRDLTAVGKRIYFVANDGEHGTELWVTDGTRKGTELTQDFLGSDPSRPEAGIDSNPTALLAVGKRIFFNYTNYPTARRARAGDVVENFLRFIGPQNSADVVPTENSEATPTSFAAIDGRAIIVHTPSTDPTNPTDDDFELWADPEPGGEFQILKDLAKGFSSFPGRHAVAGDQLFFTAYAGKNRSDGRKLCVTDGTARGTKVLADLGLSGAGDLDAIAAAGDVVYFSFRNVFGGVELWKSDGSKDGTERLMTFPIETGVTTTSITRVKDLVFFNASEGTSGNELWATNIDTDEIFRVRDLNPGEASSSPTNLTRAGKWLYFTATTANQGTELWRTDGNKTRNLTDEPLNPGAAASSSPFGLVNVEGTLYFSATAPGVGTELHRVVKEKNAEETRAAAAPIPASLFSRTSLFGSQDDEEDDESDLTSAPLAPE